MHMALMLTGAVLLATESTPPIEGRNEATAMKVADYATPAVKKTKRAYAYYRYHVYPYPVACEAVKFPRSPVCTGRPYQPNFYDF